MAHDDDARDHKNAASIYEARAGEIRTRAQQIQDLLGQLAAADSDGDSGVGANA